MKLTPSFRNVLEALSKVPDEYVLANRLPDGNGRRGGASGIKLKQMKDSGLIEYGKKPQASMYGFRITDAGRRAMLSANGWEDE